VERTLTPVVDRVEESADSLGHILFRKVVDAYTDCAAAAGKKTRGREAQSTMLGLFEARGVIPAVTAEVKQRISELK